MGEFKDISLLWHSLENSSHKETRGNQIEMKKRIVLLVTKFSRVNSYIADILAY